MHLSDGKRHTGTELAGKLGISRAAIWKHIQSIQKQGLPIQATQGKGYCLDYPICLLNEAGIRQCLPDSLQPDINIVQQTDSTNNWLKQRAGEGLEAGSVCIAEQQTAGRGTRGRTWLSPPGINIYLSLYWQFEKTPAELSGLSLAIAVALAQALEDRGYNGIMIKWPNDLYTARGKLGGLLIDMLTETNGPTQAIIGVGLNVGMRREHSAAVDQPIDDLNRNDPDWQADAPKLDRNQLAAMIIGTLNESCNTYEAQGFDIFRQQWPRWDMVQGQSVVLKPLVSYKDQQDIHGVASGIDESGALLLQTEQGLSRHASGDVSLRPEQS